MPDVNTSNPKSGEAQGHPHAFLIGGGIASLAAAVFMIRDGGLIGADITILEELPVLGGSLDAAGSPETGYVLRGGRMLESKYVCTFGLFSSIPTLDGRGTVTAETFKWNETLQTSSRSRLFRDGHRQTAPAFGLSERHILNLERLVVEPEMLIGRASIAEEFDPSFFKTDFWFMWCTTFAFQPWHSAVEFKRYLARFLHMVEGFDRLQGIMRTVYNQYDSMVRPLHKWLLGQGVRFAMGTRVTDLHMGERDGKKVVVGLATEQAGEARTITVGPDDVVLLTLGSMTETSAPRHQRQRARAALAARWQRLGAVAPHRPRPPGVRPARRIRGSCGPVQMGVLHHDIARPGPAADRAGADRQRARRGWADLVPGFRLAAVDRHPAPAALHRATRRCRACSGATACPWTSRARSFTSRWHPAPGGRS